MSETIGGSSKRGWGGVGRQDVRVMISKYEKPTTNKQAAQDPQAGLNNVNVFIILC